MPCAPGARRAAALAALAAAILCWPYLYAVGAVAYTYAWWLLPAVELASAAPLTPAEEAAGLPVPARIHQTWVDADVPEKWRAAQRSCVDLHPDYEYRLWTDAEGLELIREHYPWFLATYRAYPYTIQRVDAVRYFILHRLGGLYLDLDVGCRRRLDFLRRANFTAPLTYPVGISNDVMASAPGSAFATRAIHELTRWRRKLAVHYVTVMFSTGPMFLTVQYALSKAARRGVAAIPPATYGKYDATGDAAFFHLHGSSWHGGGAPAVFWLDAHRGKLALAALVVVIAGAALAVRRRRARRPYSPLGAAEAPADLEKQT